MLNQVVLVGRLTSDPIVKENGEKVKIRITLAIPRSYKNSEGIYETDYVDLILYDKVAKNTLEYVKKGDLIGAKGRIETEIVNDIKETNIIAEKITFLATKKGDE